jgi:hypothetical protein
MNRIGEQTLNSRERVKRGLMVWCALILIALGIWLLVEPRKARGAEFRPSDEGQSMGGMELVDNVVAAGARFSPAAVSLGCR